MRKRNFYALKQLYSRRLTLTILLISIAIIVSGCGGGGGTSTAPLAPSTVTTTRDAKGVWFIAGSEQDRLYDVIAVLNNS